MAPPSLSSLSTLNPRPGGGLGSPSSLAIWHSTAQLGGHQALSVVEDLARGHHFDPGVVGHRLQLLEGPWCQALPQGDAILVDARPLARPLLGQPQLGRQLWVKLCHVKAGAPEL